MRPTEGSQRSHLFHASIIFMFYSNLYLDNQILKLFPGNSRISSLYETAVNLHTRVYGSIESRARQPVNIVWVSQWMIYKVNDRNIPILQEAFLTFASKSTKG